MVDEKDWPSLDPERLKEEIRERIVLRGQMVGLLYPSIITDQISALREIYRAKTGRYDYP